MAKKSIDLSAIGNEVLSLLDQDHGLKPTALSIGMVLPADQFEVVATGHPDAVHPDLLQKTFSSSEPRLQWAVTIQREKRVEDFPPEFRLTPPD